jgi:hypothetical protein
MLYICNFNNNKGQCTQTKIYKTLVRPILTYRSEAWTICKSDRTRITANEMKFLRRTAGYKKLDKKRNAEILWELKINSVLEHIDQCRSNWKQYVQRMDRSRIPRQMMTYRPKGKRSFGKPLKRWRETVTGHWGLKHVRKKKKVSGSLGHICPGLPVYSPRQIRPIPIKGVNAQWSVVGGSCIKTHTC